MEQMETLYRNQPTHRPWLQLYAPLPMDNKDLTEGVEKVSLADDLMKELGIQVGNRRFAMRAIWYCAVSLSVGYMLGWLGSFGIPSPFVRTAEIQNLANNQEEIKKSQAALADDMHSDRVERMDARILTLTTSKCKAQEGSSARQTYTEELEEIIRRYKKLTGEYPRVPDCREVADRPAYYDMLPALLAEG
jgi:hypothetical protein